jgi:hypothetical protein
VRDLLLLQEPPDGVAAHRAQAHVAAADGGHAPSRAPPVAMEHRERPQVDGLRAVLRVQDLPEAVQIRAPVGVDDALGLPGGPRRVVDRDRRQLVLDRPGQRLVGPTLEQVGIAGPAGRLGVIHLGHRVGDRDDLPDRRELVPERGDDRAQLRVDHQQLGPGVLTDVAHLLSRQTGVDGHQNRSRQRNCKVRDQQLGDVRAQVGHAIARLDPRRLQRLREASGLAGEIAIDRAAIAVDDRHLVGIHLGGTLQETQRRQRGVRHGGHRGTPLLWTLERRPLLRRAATVVAHAALASPLGVQSVRTPGHGRKTPGPTSTWLRPAGTVVLRARPGLFADDSADSTSWAVR